MTIGEVAAPALRLAIIGAGRAGRHFALRCLSRGQPIVLEDVLPAKLRSAAVEIAQHIPVASARVTLVSSVEDAVRDADLVIDFVPDELESKLEIFSLIDRMAPPRTILLTPSDALSIADLASCTYRPDRCFALRGFDSAITSSADAQTPVDSGVELTLTYPACRDESALAHVEGLLSRLGWAYTVAQDELPSMLTGR